MYNLSVAQINQLRLAELVLTDEDFRTSNSIDDITQNNVRFTRNDIDQSHKTTYRGKLGEKVLKDRNPNMVLNVQITRKELNITAQSHST